MPELGNFRWLTVGVPGQPEVSITLMAVPGPPVFEPRPRPAPALVAKGAAAVSSSTPTTSMRRTRS